MKKPKPKRKPKTHEEISETQSDFSFAIARIAVSQICRSVVGLKGSQLSALNTLTVITTKYIQTLAKTAVSFSTAANRTQPNLFDSVNALNDLSSSTQGLFNGPSTLHGSSTDCLLLGSSGILKEIMDFVSYTNEIPFAKPVPRQEMASCWWALEKGVNNDDQRKLCLHIPKWLPEFPDQIGNDHNNNNSSSNSRRIKGEKLWEDSETVALVSKNGEWESFVGGFGSCKDSDSGGDLPMERMKVRFKIEGGDRANKKGGVKVRNGMCRGGKRVCWSGCGSHEIDQEKWGGGLKKKKIMS